MTRTPWWSTSVKQVTTDYDLLTFSVANGVATYQSTRSCVANGFSTNIPVEIAYPHAHCRYAV